MQKHLHTATLNQRLLAILFLGGLALLATSTTYAAATLTVTPITWNIIGLDSNNPASGPYRFPVGARVCNTSGSATTATVNYVWDNGLGVFWGDSGADTYINLRTGSLASTTLTFTGNGCQDAYFEVEVARVNGAFEKTRRYHITATDTSGTASTPTPRELYVEHLISQNRNGITDIKLNGASIPAGGTMTLMVGNTYTIELDGFTATQGYNQLESFINFPNTIFQILSVNTTYSADSNTTNVPNPNSTLYANACIWDEDPGSPNYRSCIGGDDKAGGTVITTYTVRIIGGAGTSQPLNTLLYDFSGSSFHYNADFSTGARIASIISPASVTIQKSFSPKAVSPGGTATMSFKLTNPTTEIFTGVNFTDTLPSGLVVAGTPGVSYSGCGAGAFSPALSGGETSVSFAGGTLSANSICTVTVSVSAASAGAYPNTTGHLFINTSTDTGNFGSDTLTASSAPACTAGQTVARWTVPASATNPPDMTGGIPTTIGTNVITATASFNTTNGGVSLIDNSNGQNDSSSWKTYGWRTAGSQILFKLDTSHYSGNSMSFYARRDATAGPTSLTVEYSTDNGSSYGGTTTSAVNNTFTQYSISIPQNNTVWVKITASDANNDNQGADFFVDDILFTGCAIPAPAPTIVKSFAPISIAKGTNSTLSFTISNTVAGNLALTGVAFTDVLPAGLSVADSSSSQCGGTLSTTAATRTIALTGGSLGASGSCTFNVTVTGATEGQYDNVTGYISSTESGASTNYATASLTVIAPPVLAKSFTPASIFTGNTSALSFIITNPNLSSSLSIMGFTDSLPVGLTVANSGPTATCGGVLTTIAPSTLSFSGGSLAANSSCTFGVTVTGATAGTKNNTTSVVTSTEGGNGNASSASLVVSDPVALIGLIKQISTDNTTWFKYVGLIPTQNAYYRFTVSNDGEVTLNDVSVADPNVNVATCAPALPASLAVGASASCVVGPVSITSVPTPNPFVNTATVTTSTYTPATPITSSAKYGTESLTVTKSVTETYFTAAGNVLHYSYLVTNNGGYPLLGPVTVADDKASDESCPAANTVGDGDDYLDPGESVTCISTYTVTAGDVTVKFVTNTASATAGGVTSSTDSETVNLAPDLTVAKSNNVSGSVELGNTFTWTLTVTNSASAGPASFANTQTLLTDDLPTTGATYSAGTVTSAGGTSGTINCAIAANTLTCSANGIVSIPAGGSFSVPITVTPTAAGSLVNPRGGGVFRVDPGNLIAEIDETNNDGVSNTVSVTVSADLSIAKSHSGNFTVGVNASYAITVTNNGPSDVVAPILVTDTLPTGLSAISNSAGWTCTPFGQVISCNSDAGLAVGTNLPLVLNVSVGAGAAPNVTNSVEVSNAASDPILGNNTATDPTVVNTAPDLALTKTHVGAVAPSGILVYTLGYTNTGDLTATGVVVTETVPANTRYTGSGWSCPSGSGAGTICTRSVSDVAGSGGNGSVSFSVTISNPLPIGTTQIANTATITDDGTHGPDATPSNNSATDNAPLTGSAPDLRVSKSDGGLTPTPGGVLTYTLTFTNTGTIGATNVVLTETIPADTVYAGTGWNCSPNNLAGSICTRNIGTLAGGGAGGSAQFIVTINNPLPPSTTQITNTVAIGDDGANGADANPGDNTATINTPVLVSGALCVTVYNDLNGNGTRQLGEGLLSGALITATNVSSVVVGTWTTNGSEPHCFTDLPAGEYSVAERNPVGYSSTSPDVVSVSVSFGVSTLAEFGDQQFTPTPTATRTATPNTEYLYLPIVIKAAPVTPPIAPTPSRTPTATATRVMIDPKGMLSDPNRDLLYLVSNGDNTVDVFQESTIATNPLPLLKIGVGRGPFGIGGIFNNQANDKVYVANFSSNNVSVIRASDLVKLPDISLASCGGEPTHLAVNPGMGLVYVALHSGAKVAVIDTNTDTLTRCISVSGQGTFGGTFGLAVDTGTNSIFAGNRDTFDLWRIDGFTNVATRVRLYSTDGDGGSPFYVGFNEITRKLFVMVGFYQGSGNNREIVPNRLYISDVDWSGNLSNETVIPVGNTDDGGYVVQSICSGYIYVAETADSSLRVLDPWSDPPYATAWLTTQADGYIDGRPYGLLESMGATFTRIYVSHKNPANTLRILDECPGPFDPFRLPRILATPTRPATRTVTPTRTTTVAPTTTRTLTVAPTLTRTATPTIVPTRTPTATPTRTSMPSSIPTSASPPPLTATPSKTPTATMTTTK